MERRFLCKQCQYVFDAAISDVTSPDTNVHCPVCCGTNVTEAPPWAPLGSGLNIFESDTWEYECQQCLHKFTMPIPQSPTEDRNRRCPLCNSGHLHLLTGKKALPLYCG
jgi:DNA-directed RNA polymerase subunit RPC12/RpoP